LGITSKGLSALETLAKKHEDTFQKEELKLASVRYGDNQQNQIRADIMVLSDNIGEMIENELRANKNLTIGTDYNVKTAPNEDVDEAFEASLKIQGRYIYNSLFDGEFKFNTTKNERGFLRRINSGINTLVYGDLPEPLEITHTNRLLVGRLPLSTDIEAVQSRQKKAANIIQYVINAFMEDTGYPWKT